MSELKEIINKHLLTRGENRWNILGGIETLMNAINVYEQANSSNVIRDVSDSPIFADWLIKNYSPYVGEFGRKTLPEGKWRKDYTQKIYDTQELYLIFKGAR